MRATSLLSRVLLALLSPGRGVALQGPVGDLGMSNTEQLERTVRDINRLEATLENALPANLRTIANASQNWSPLDEEQERQEAEVNAAVAAATQQERRATEQLAAVRAQAAAVGARRQVRRFVNAGMLSHAPPPPPSPNVQTAQQLALEAQEVRVALFERTLTTPRSPSHTFATSHNYFQAGRAALHAATLAMRMAALSSVAPAPVSGGRGTQPQPQPQPLSEAGARSSLPARSGLPRCTPSPPSLCSSPSLPARPPLAPRLASFPLTSPPSALRRGGRALARGHGPGGGAHL